MEEVTPVSGDYQACPHCHGNKICPDCGGNGILYDHDAEGNVIPGSGTDCFCIDYKAGKCPKCRSTGRFYPEMYGAPYQSDRMEQLYKTIEDRESHSRDISR